MSQYDRHLTTEQLSASLDKELSQEEQAELEVHLASCEQCQIDLAGLRKTVALLHALPQPALPRSFALPLDSITAPTTTRVRTTATPLAGAQHGIRAAHPQQRALRTTVQVISTLAAMVGIVFLLSGVLAGLPAGGASSTGGGSSAAPSSNSAGPSTATRVTQQAVAGAQPRSPDATIPVIAPTLSAMAASPTTQDQPIASPTAEHFGNNTGSKPLDTSFFLDLSTAGGRTWLGTILLILSIGGLIFLRAQRQRVEPD